jgi:hypothetical protein
MIKIYATNGGANYMKNDEKSKQFFSLMDVGIERRKVDNIPVRIILTQERIYPIEVECPIDENSFCIVSLLEYTHDMSIAAVEYSRYEILIKGIHEDICTRRGSEREIEYPTHDEVKEWTIAEWEFLELCTYVSRRCVSDKFPSAGNRHDIVDRDIRTYEWACRDTIVEGFLLCSEPEHTSNLTIGITFEFHAEKLLEFLTILRGSWADSLEIEGIPRACERSEVSIDFSIVFLRRDMRHLDEHESRLPVREGDFWNWCRKEVRESGKKEKEKRKYSGKWKKDETISFHEDHKIPLSSKKYSKEGNEKSEYDRLKYWLYWGKYSCKK